VPHYTEPVSPARHACMGMCFTEASMKATCASGGAGDITDRHSQEHGQIGPAEADGIVEY
jgi:hypothetical protein